MSNLGYLLFFLSLILLSYLYFWLARRFKIVDIPNHRTMHKGATIRGGGLVVWIGMIGFSFVFSNPGIYFLVGLILIGATGFLDDLIDLSSKVRFPIQAISIILIIWQLQLIDGAVIWLLLTVIIGTGILNAFNFMDGINGITVGYSLVFVCTLLYIQHYQFSFIDVSYLHGYLLGLLAFGFFNFRKKAVCFAGDVGSLTIAFINIFLLMKLMVEVQSLRYLFLFSVYGIDTIFTIIQRIFRKENIFEAHKLHLFQEIVSRTRISHLGMTTIYMSIQLLINFVIISSYPASISSQWFIILVMLCLLSLLYIWFKSKLIKE